MFAADIRRKRAQRMRAFTQWQWHLDEMFVKINGETRYLWRAVDHEGEVLEAFVSKTRDRKAALKFLRKLMKRNGSPRAAVTDKLRSYRAALKKLDLQDRQHVGRWLNNRAENSHLPLRRRERAMQRFRPLLDPKPLQPGPAPQSQEYLQASPHRRPCRVASARRGLTSALLMPNQDQFALV